MIGLANDFFEVNRISNMLYILLSMRFYNLLVLSIKSIKLT